MSLVSGGDDFYVQLLSVSSALTVCVQLKCEVR